MIVSKCPESATLDQPVGFHRPRLVNSKWIEGDPVGKAKHLRDVAARAAKCKINELIVTTESGLQFNACDVSQNRICRAVLRMSPGETESWVMADKSVSLVSREDLMGALRLAGKKHTSILVEGK